MTSAGLLDRSPRTSISGTGIILDHRKDGCETLPYGAYEIMQSIEPTNPLRALICPKTVPVPLLVVDPVYDTLLYPP